MLEGPPRVTTILSLATHINQSSVTLKLIVCFGEKELFIHGTLIVVPVQPLLCIQVCTTKHKRRRF